MSPHSKKRLSNCRNTSLQSKRTLDCLPAQSLKVQCTFPKISLTGLSEEFFLLKQRIVLLNEQRDSARLQTNEEIRFDSQSACSAHTVANSVSARAVAFSIHQDRFVNR